MMTPTQPKLRLKDKRRRLVWVKVAAGTAIVALSFGLLVYAAHRPEVNIGKIHVEGAKLAKPELVQKVTDAVLEDSYFFLIPRTNVFVVPYSRIETAITKSFPQVASVVASQNGIGDLTIQVTERVPVALWCEEQSREDTVLDVCYLMDGNGFIFEKGDGEGFAKYRGLIEGTPIGKQYLDDTFRNFTKTIAELEGASARKVRDVVIDEHDDVYATFTEGGYAIFTLQAEYQNLMDNVASVFASERFKTGAALEYADFRFGNKVYVKFAGE